MATPTNETAPADDLPIRTLLEERDLLLAYINVFTHNIDAAEDILQDAMMLALRQRFADISQARGWIRVTARNLALSEGRRKQRRGKLLPDDVLELLEPVWGEDTSDPHREKVAALRTCFAHLSASGQRLIDLRFNHGLSGEAIASAVGRPLNTVYVGLTRVYRRLANCIERRLGQA